MAYPYISINLYNPYGIRNRKDTFSCSPSTRRPKFWAHSPPHGLKIQPRIFNFFLKAHMSMSGLWVCEVHRWKRSGLLSTINLAERERVSFWEEKAGQTLLELRKLDESEKRGRGVIYNYIWLQKRVNPIKSNLIQSKSSSSSLSLLLSRLRLCTNPI